MLHCICGIPQTTPPPSLPTVLPAPTTESKEPEPSPSRTLSPTSSKSQKKRSISNDSQAEVLLLALPLAQWVQEGLDDTSWRSTDGDNSAEQSAAKISNSLMQWMQSHGHSPFKLSPLECHLVELLCQTRGRLEAARRTETVTKHQNGGPDVVPAPAKGGVTATETRTNMLGNVMKVIVGPLNFLWMMLLALMHMMRIDSLDTHSSTCVQHVGGKASDRTWDEFAKLAPRERAKLLETASRKRDEFAKRHRIEELEIVRTKLAKGADQEAKAKVKQIRKELDKLLEEVGADRNGGDAEAADQYHLIDPEPLPGLAELARGAPPDERASSRTSPPEMSSANRSGWLKRALSLAIPQLRELKPGGGGYMHVQLLDLSLLLYPISTHCAGPHSVLPSWATSGGGLYGGWVRPEKEATEVHCQYVLVMVRESQGAAGATWLSSVNYTELYVCGRVWSIAGTWKSVSLDQRSVTGPQVSLCRVEVDRSYLSKAVVEKLGELKMELVVQKRGQRPTTMAWRERLPLQLLATGQPVCPQQWMSCYQGCGLLSEHFLLTRPLQDDERLLGVLERAGFLLDKKVSRVFEKIIAGMKLRGPWPDQEVVEARVNLQSWARGSAYVLYLRVEGNQLAALKYVYDQVVLLVSEVLGLDPSRADKFFELYY